MVRTAVSDAADRSTLNIGESLSVFFTGLMLIYAAITGLDPARMGWGTSSLVVSKYLCIVFGLLALLAALGGGLSRATFRNPALYSIIVLASLQVGGGAYAFYFEKKALEETFIGRGLFSFMAVVGILVASNARIIQKLRLATELTATIYAYAGSLIMLLFSSGLIFIEQSQALHIELYLIVAGAIWISETKRNPMIKFMFLPIFAFITVESAKATAYLLFIVMIYIGYFGRGVVKERKRRRNYSWPKILMLIFLTPLTLFAANHFVGQHGAVNENDLRFYLWEARLNQFFDSPWYGTLFTGSPLLPRPNDARLSVPSHNDFLDILSQGGLISFILFLVILICSLRSKYAFQAIFAERATISFTHFYAFLFIAWAVASLGNPVFSTPALAVPAWFSIGVMCSRRKAAVRLPQVPLTPGA